MAAILENQQSAITPELNGWIFSKLKVTEVKVQNGTNIGTFHYCLT
jgi:hypothetical protein